jgi:cytochrome P450
VEKFNPTLARLNKDPYPIYRQYRESDPVHLGMPLCPEYAESWYLFRHEDIGSVLGSRLFINDSSKTSDGASGPAVAPSRKAFWGLVEKWLLLLDPPDHTRIRSQVSRSFTRQSAEQLIPFIQKTADDLLDRVIDRGEVDIVRDFAVPLPVAVIAQLLGLRFSDTGELRTWSRSIANAMAPEATPNLYDDALEKTRDFSNYLQQTFRETRKKPGNNLISSLLQAQDDGGLDENELVSLCSMIIFAGQETTIDAIGNSLLALLQHPDQLEKLQSRPALLPNAVEELLRYNSPVQLTMVRFPTEDVEIGGKQIRRGNGVTAILGSANHDQERFDNPEKLDITRTIKSRDVIFGQGIHRCLGAHLARMELQIVLGTLLRRVKSLQLESDQLQWRQNVVFRGLTSLPVSFKAS